MELISDKTKLQSDVAGATFMAFGCSAPELFASIIGELQEFMYILGFWCTIFYMRDSNMPGAKIGLDSVPGFPALIHGGLFPTAHALGGESAGNQIAVETRRYSSSKKCKKPKVS